MYELFLLLFVFTCFSIRAIPRIIRKNSLVADTYFHLFCANVIRSHHFHVPGKYPGIMVNNTYSYPYLYPFILSLVSPKQRAWCERFTGAFFDSINCLLFLGFTAWLLPYLDADIYSAVPFWIIALLVFSPALLRIGSGPRAYNGSPRVFGQTLYFIHLISFVVGYQTGERLFLIISILSGAALILSAKFGTQVLFFFGIFFGLLVTPIYLILLALCVLASVILSKGRSLTILAGMIRNSRFYYRYLQEVYLLPLQRSFSQYFYAGASSFYACIRKKDTRIFTGWFYSESYPLHLLLTVFPQFLLIPFWISTYSAQSPPVQFLTIWAMAGLAAFVITKTRYVLFLGEGERYLEYALFPSLFLGIVWCISHSCSILLAVFLIYSVLSAMVFIASYCNNYKKTDDDFFPIQRAFQELRTNYAPGVILPIGSYNWLCVYSSDLPVLTAGNLDERGASGDEFKLIYGNYPYPSKDFRRIIDEYHVAYLVSDDVHINHYKNTILEDRQWFDTHVEPVIKTDTLTIFRVVGP